MQGFWGLRFGFRAKGSSFWPNLEILVPIRRALPGFWLFLKNAARFQAILSCSCKRIQHHQLKFKIAFKMLSLDLLDRCGPVARPRSTVLDRCSTAARPSLDRARPRSTVLDRCSTAARPLLDRARPCSTVARPLLARSFPVLLNLTKTARFGTVFDVTCSASFETLPNLSKSAKSRVKPANSEPRFPNLAQTRPLNPKP